MPLQISGNNFEITPSLKQYIEEKIGGVRNYFQEVKKIQVSLEVDHHHQKGDAVHRVHITVHIPKEAVHIDAATSEMHAAIDKAEDKLRKHLGMYKKRLAEQDRTTLRRLKETVLVWPKNFMRRSVMDSTAGMQQQREGEVASGGVDEYRTLTDIKPITEEEALENWRVSGLTSYLYIDAQNNRPTMLTRDSKTGKCLAMALTNL